MGGSAKVKAQGSGSAVGSDWDTFDVWDILSGDLTSYHIVDKETLSVEERDLYVSGMIKAVHQFWEETDLEVCLQMTKQDMVKKLQEIAETCSNEKITVTVSEDDVGYEYMDERRFDKEKL